MECNVSTTLPTVIERERVNVWYKGAMKQSHAVDAAVATHNLCRKFYEHFMAILRKSWWSSRITGSKSEFLARKAR